MAEKELFFRKLGEGKPLIILHGLFGASDNWLSIGKVLSEHFEVYLLDQRNHGQSFHDPEHNFEVMADDLARFIENRGIEHPVLLGHSMGGKVAMRFVLDHPGVAEKLIVVDISPRGYKVHHDKILAGLKSIDLAALTSRKEADDQLAAYVPDMSERQFLLKSLGRTDSGFEWKINVAALDDNIGLIVGEISGKPSNIPTLFIDGEHSNYIREIDLPIIAELFPNSKVVTIKSAGHWVHAEQPQAFLETISAFLQQSH
jgi:esterase